LPDARPGFARVRRAIRGLAGALVVLAAVVLAGCQASPNLEASAGSIATATPKASTATPTPAAATQSPAPSATSDAIVVDEDLLRILPEQVAGVPIEPSPETAGAMIADRELRRTASGLMVGMAIEPGASGADDLAVATIIKLRPGVFNDAFFTGWRGAYDGAACAQAGGIASHDQRTIGAHQVDVTLCTGGAQTYHVHLDGDVIVSITAAGDRRFGELVLAGLRE
jgi:hypothetical protein